MAKYGLAQVDLNQLVKFCCGGVLDEPERHLSRLLRSHQPIERSTRIALADALDGKSKGSKLKFTQTKYGDLNRRFRKNRERLNAGRKVQALAAEKGYESAVDEVAADSPWGQKTIQNCYTLANKCDDWVRQCRNSGVEYSDAALETAYIYATTMRIDAFDGLKPSIESLTQLLYLFEHMLVDAHDLSFELKN